MIKYSKRFFKLINQVKSQSEKISEHVILVTNIEGNFGIFVNLFIHLFIIFKT